MLFVDDVNNNSDHKHWEMAEGANNGGRYLIYTEGGNNIIEISSHIHILLQSELLPLTRRTVLEY